MKHSRPLIAALAALIFSCSAIAEDGYDLWLRYRSIDTSAHPALVYKLGPIVMGTSSTSTLVVVGDELRRGLDGLGILPAQTQFANEVKAPGAVVFGTPESSPLIASLNLPLKDLGKEGFLIRATKIKGQPGFVIAANTDVGVLYGSFEFLRMLQTRQRIEHVDFRSKPRTRIRVLNHWDNLDRHVERGYAGESIWDWHKLPGWVDTRYTDYARANASIGINGTVLTNVNANATSLTAPYIEKARAIALALQPYGIRVYLTARFSAPIELGGLKTADPLDPAVRAWWKAKVDEIYAAIPDFGGFLVKANSEGQPGPQEYKRTHADGANMLAEALAPHHGVVMWRAFVYSNETPTDRAKQAYDEFVPLDGKFADNVLVQVKNGAIDFQPREPFHPLFGAMPKTPLMMEVEITKEYLGFATHLAYLGTMWEEVLRADTRVNGRGSTVARVIDGDLHGYKLTGMAGVANIGSDRNWSGSHFDQANWYAFGRLAWDPQLSARDIAEEWTRMTFTNDPRFVKSVVGMMMDSRDAVVDYMTPLGLAHLMGTGHHYGPAPWVNDLGRADWNPTYYHRADANGIGFDRGKQGSNAIAQYSPDVAKIFGDPDEVPEEFLLWFHHLPWSHPMPSGRTLWDEMVFRYDRGVKRAETLRNTWYELMYAPDMGGYIDRERYAQIKAFLQIQLDEAQWWRDACIAYFQSVNQLPLPAGAAPPKHPLEYYKALKFPYAPGRT
ncbi:MAG TPA: alpha-glucuronidase family glycosyl hydrolase [Steroidobacteraceae bacterium]|nr:alpha-glucuronidase family glycosyl hydrolase [Steroidobacteraceae bacterium]